MRNSKGLKFSYLVVLFVCIATFFSGMITSVMSMSSALWVLLQVICMMIKS